MLNHSLVRTLRTLRGNVRGCVYTEPLWGIPYKLYAPFASVYMLALGLTDSRIGLLTTIGLVLGIFWMTASGAITDKLGRKRTTLIFDIVSWSVPCLIWAIAQDFTYFLAAAIVNSVWRVSSNSWQCLLVEDADPGLLVDVWSWIYISGLLAGFVSPVTGLLIERFTLVPTMRGLYLLALVMMTSKFVITNRMVTETQQGLIRMEATRNSPLFDVLREYPAVLGAILRSPATLFTGGMLVIVGITNMVSGTFWSILVTEKLQIPAQHLAVYPFVRSLVMLLFFFLVMPRLRDIDVRKPMVLGFLGLIASHAILISAPAKSYALVLVATILEGCSIPTANTLLDKLVVLTIDAGERARIQAILFTVVLAVVSPFGWIAGWLSEINRSLPFVLSTVLFGIGALLAFLAGRVTRGGAAIEEAAEQAA